MQELLKNSFILSFAEILLKVAKLLFFIVIANVYFVENLGIFNYIMSFLIIFLIIGELGINTYVTTEQSKLDNFPDSKLLSIGIFKFFTVLIVFIIAFFLYIILEKHNIYIFILLAFLVFSDSILLLVYSFYRAIDQFQYEFYYKIIQATIYILISLITYYEYRFDFESFIFLITVFNFILALISLYNLTHFTIYVKNSINYIKQNYLNHFQDILPIFLITIFTTLYFRIDILMIENILDMQSVGYYSIAFKLIEGAMVLPLMLGVVFLPKLAKNRKNITADLFLHFFLGLVIFILFYLTIEFVINILFVKDYVYSVEVAKILSFSIVIMSVNTYMFNYFIATKQSYVNVKITLIMLLLNLILNFIFIPMYGISAAAYTTVGTELIGMFALFYYMKRYYVSC